MVTRFAVLGVVVFHLAPVKGLGNSVVGAAARLASFSGPGLFRNEGGGHCLLHFRQVGDRELPEGGGEYVPADFFRARGSGQTA